MNRNVFPLEVTPTPRGIIPSPVGIQAAIDGCLVGKVSIRAGAHTLDGLGCIAPLITEIPREQSVGRVRHVGINFSGQVRWCRKVLCHCALKPHRQSVRVDLNIRVVKASNPGHGSEVLIPVRYSHPTGIRECIRCSMSDSLA